MNIKKLASLLTCGFTIFGTNFNSMAMKENLDQPSENTNLISGAERQEPQLRDFTEDMYKKRGGMLRVPYNDKWLLVNRDLSPFRMGSKSDISEQSFFYYSFDDNDYNLKRQIERHPIAPPNDLETRLFKLPLSNNPSKSMIICYTFDRPCNGVFYSYGDNNDKFNISLPKEKYYTDAKRWLRQDPLLRRNRDLRRQALRDIATSRAHQKNQSYLFETKNLLFLKDIRNEPEESEIGRWFKENKDEIESYAKGFSWGKMATAVVVAGGLIFFEELIRRNLP